MEPTNNSAHKIAPEMELTRDHPLFEDAQQAAKIALERLEASTRKNYQGALTRFEKFCEASGYPNPLTTRFPALPTVMTAYINKISKNATQWPAEKLRAAISWHYSTPDMLRGSHPHDLWIVETDEDGKVEARGNPAKAVIVGQVMNGLSKLKKRTHNPTRASPMSLSMLHKMMIFLRDDTNLSETMRVWFSAVSSLCFYGMCRINEVLTMKYKDVTFGLERHLRTESGEWGEKTVQFGCFVIRDRKTDHDPSASRTYNMHKLPDEEWACEAYTHVKAWVDYAEGTLNHHWADEDFIFPGLTRVPRVEIKRPRTSGVVPGGKESFQRVGVKWGSSMTDSNFIQVLNIVASTSEINQGILGDKIWFTSHCFRRGGAQYRFMFAPEKRRWSLKLVKWWAGWASGEQSDTLVRYLLDDVLDREEASLSDSLAPDIIMHAVNSREISTPVTPSHTQPPSTVPPQDLLSDLLQRLEPKIESILESKLNKILSNITANTASPSSTGIEQVNQGCGSLSSNANEQQMSDLPEAESWKDYVTQYWSSDPARHQYRAGVDFLPHEKRRHKARLSRMKLIAKFVRAHYEDDTDAFETAFTSLVEGQLTVNKIYQAIRQAQQ